MQKLIMSRGTGKTTLLIRQSSATKTPILCATTTMTKFIKRTAENLGVEIPEPISATDAANILRGKTVSSVLVDDADAVLDVLLYDKYGVVVQALAMSP